MFWSKAKKKGRGWQQLVVVSAIVLVGSIIGCQAPVGSGTLSDKPDTPSDDGPSAGSSTNLRGTIALDNGEAAVLELEFDSGSTRNARSGSVSVSGFVRYQSEDYVVGGLFDPETSELDLFAENSAGQRFVFSGTYDAINGFSGSVSLLASDGTTVLASGSVSAAVDDDAAPVAGVFTGRFGGQDSGAWNATVSVDSISGSYASEIFEGVSGTLVAARAGDTFTYDDGSLRVTGRVSADGNYLTGTWNNLVLDYSGTWSGSKVDSNNDSTLPTSSSDSEFIATLTNQALATALIDYEDNVIWADTDGDPSTQEGSTYNGITGTIHSAPGGGISHIIYEVSYSDAPSGLELSGQVRIELSGTSTDRFGFVMDSDVSNAVEDDGITITFPDGSTTPFFADFAYNDTLGNVESFNLASPTYQIGGVSVSKSEEFVSLYF